MYVNDNFSDLGKLRLKKLFKKKSFKVLKSLAKKKKKPVPAIYQANQMPYQAPIQIFKPSDSAVYMPPEQSVPQDWATDEMDINQEMPQGWEDEEEFPEGEFSEEMSGLEFDWGGLMSTVSTGLKSGLKTGVDIFSQAVQLKQAKEQTKQLQAQSKAALAATKLTQAQADSKKKVFPWQMVLAIALPVGALGLLLIKKSRKNEKSV
jgi:hypothetical protein